MKIIKINIWMTLLLIPGLVSCEEKPTMKFSVQVVDDAGLPIAHCKVKAVVFSHWKAGEGFGKSYNNIFRVETDSLGVSNFQIASKTRRLSYHSEALEGYYRTHSQEYFFEASAKNGVWQPENKKFKVVLKRKKNPIAMYANKTPREMPDLTELVGYDLIIGDWIVPNGKGKVPDISFKFSEKKYKLTESELKKYGSNYFGESALEVIFNNKGDGLIPFEAPLYVGSKFRSTYKAPEKGYQNRLVHKRAWFPEKTLQDTRKKTMNYYIRVRTNLDEKGNVIKAHYGKIYGDFMGFTHYLNPTPNDRNVEFNPKKNLIDTGFRGHKVQNP